MCLLHIVFHIELLLNLIRLSLPPLVLAVGYPPLQVLSYLFIILGVQQFLLGVGDHELKIANVFVVGVLLFLCEASHTINLTNVGNKISLKFCVPLEVTIQPLLGLDWCDLPARVEHSLVN